MAELLGSLLVRLGLESGAFKSGLDSSTKEFKKAQRQFEQIGQSMANVGKNLTLGVTLPMIALGAQAVKGAKDQAQAVAQVEAALTSMGNASGKTSAELVKTADALEMKSLFDADVILTKVTANLLTFGNVAGEVFDRAQQAAIDMAQRMGNDPQGAAIMLGKALNDPIKGITALTRVGVQFTDAQKKQIKAFQDSGQAAKAQGIILSEVERQFAGAAEAAANTEPLRKAEVAWNQAMDKIGEAILPLIPKISAAIEKVAMAFANLPEGAQNLILIGAAITTALGPVIFIIGSLVKLAAPLAAAFATTAAATATAGTAAAGASTGFAALAAAAAPWIAAAAAIAGAGYLIYQNWDKIAPVLGKVWDAISATLGPPVQAIISTLSAMFSELWSGPFGDGIREAGARLAAFGAAVADVLGPVLLTALKLAFTQIGNVLTALLEFGRALGALFRGDVLDALSHFAKSIDNLFGGIPGKIIGWISDMVRGIGTWMVGRLNAIWDSVKGKIDAVRGWFYGLYDAVVGHSYVPDMVDLIGVHMRRLDAEMVEPVKKATGKAGEAFRALQQEVAGILARLFPGQAAQLAFEKELAALNLYFDTLIKRGKDALTVEQERLAAVTALRREYSGWDQHVEEEANKPIGVTPGTKELGDISAEISERMGVALGKVGKQAEVTKVQVVESFAQMVDGSLREIDRFVNGIKSGNWLDTISGLLNAIDKIAGIVTGGKGTNIGPFSFGGGGVDGARAIGGPVMGGRSYLVGEEGEEIFTPRTSGSIIPNDKIGGGGDTYHFSGNLLTPEWWAQIRAGDMAAAQAGSANAQAVMHRNVDRSLA